VYYLPEGKENYYELKQTKFVDIRDKKVYYTLSAKGLTVYHNKTPKEFIKLSEWIMERQAYNKITTINFFKNFKIWRIIKIWRKNIFRHKKSGRREELDKKFLFNMEDYTEKIILHRQYCNEAKHLSILDLRVSLESTKYDDFQKKQETKRNNLNDSLSSIHNRCETIFVEGTKKIFNKVRNLINQQNNESNYNNSEENNRKKNKRMATFNKKKQLEQDKDDNNNNNNDEQILNDENLVGFENYCYKDRMLIKNECLNFIKLAYLFDYIMLDVLRRMYLDSLGQIIQRLNDFNKVEEPKAVRENITNKVGEFVKQVNNNSSRLIPYFLVNVNIASKPIENRDLYSVKVKPFYLKHTADDEFDPVAHIQVEEEEQKGTKDEVYVTEEKKDIEMKLLNRPHYYFVSFDPGSDQLIEEILKQIKMNEDQLRIRGWRAHSKFTQTYLKFLDDLDDICGNWEEHDGPLFINPINTFDENDKLFHRKEEILREAIKFAYSKCENYLQKLNPHLQLHYKQTCVNKELLLRENLKDADEMLRLIVHYTEKKTIQIKQYVPFEEELGLIKITLEDGLRKSLLESMVSIVAYLKPELPGKIRDRASNVEKWFNDMLKKLEGNIDNEVTYLEKSAAKDDFDNSFGIYERKLNTIDNIFTFLKPKGFQITNEDLKYISDINSTKFKVKSASDSLTDLLIKKKENLRTKVVNDLIPDLFKKIEDIYNRLRDEQFYTYDPAVTKAIIPSFILELEKLEADFKHQQKNYFNYNEFLKKLGENEINFSNAEGVYDNLKTLKDLWNSLKNFDDECEEWKKTRFSDINTTEILNKIDDYLMVGRRAMANFGDEHSAVNELIENVTKFKESMQVIDNLNCVYLQLGDWQEIQEFFPTLGESQRLETKDYALEFLLQIGAYKYQRQIFEIKTKATVFHQLKNQMNEIKIMEKQINLEVSLEKDDYTIKAIDGTIEKLEECQALINNVLANKYSKLIVNANEQKREIDTLIDIMEDMKVFQAKWKYIDSIISSGDMKKKMPDISFFDEKVDKEWKAFVGKCRDNPSVSSLYKRFQNSQDFFTKKIEYLEIIQHKIEEELRQMRDDFERFYFISNDDLLFMLARFTGNITKGLEDIKPYLIKIFEDINDIEVNQNNYIQKIIGIAKEEFPIKPVKVTEKLEDWLKELDISMVKSVREKIWNSINEGFIRVDNIDCKLTYDYETFVTTFKSQVASTLAHINFCETTEYVIRDLLKIDTLALSEWYQIMCKVVDIYTKLVNKPFDKNVRRLVSNLITHHIYYRNILEYLSTREIDIETVDDFDWQKQIRAYSLPSEESSIGHVKIRQLKTEITYGYEYLGPNNRVVITALTDRVWLTMTAGLYIKLGCSLGGPAGTGKTETTKDLSKFLGIQCIVFNCSEQIDYKLIGNLFSGLCLHKQGAFACLDEFNRIGVEVLSVVASQLLNIRLKLMEPPSENRYVYILNEVKLVGKLVGIYVTMNPTYSGRTELPDNLKSLFRPITMMVPDFQTIAEVKLSSEGFQSSVELARKLTRLYALASQQLSQQDHYDFTLRTIGSVLSIAGNLKRASKVTGERVKKEEETILINALRDANFPKFLPQDIKLFSALLSDLFPKNELQDPALPDFETQLIKIIEKEKYHNNDFTRKKCMQLFDIVNIRLGVCLTGPAGTGKSTCLKLTQKTMNALRLQEHPDPRFKTVDYNVINPKSISMGELYGQEHEETKTFSFGIATMKIKEALLQESESHYYWVVLDGPIDTKWIENMNSVLDDSMTLCLANGERIKLRPHIKILFETEDLSKASLATVSRLGIIFLGQGELGWRPYYYHWLNTYLHDESILFNDMKNFLTQLFDTKLDEAFDNLDDFQYGVDIFIKPVPIQCVRSICTFMETYLKVENNIMESTKPITDPEHISRIKKKIISIFCMGLVWGVFGACSNKVSQKISSFVRNKFQEIKSDAFQSIMDYYYDINKADFVKYNLDNVPFNYVRGQSFFSLYVPTADTIKYSEIIEMLLTKQQNIFVSGETGVGKTVLLQTVLRKLLATEEHTDIQLNFSAKTSSEDTQRSLESKLEKKKGKKVLHGQNGKKLTVFIDDVNMPEPNEFGSHAPIELLRQFLDLGGFYDRPAFFWKSIEDTCLLAAGGPPIGGRSKLTDRFIRHFFVINIPQPDKLTKNYIFENILRGFLNSTNFSEAVKKYYIDITAATMDIYDFMCENLKPIPSKFHYTFNLRDVGKVFQGLLMIIPSSIQAGDVFCRLWIHEVLRVFGDRLINETDLRRLEDNIVTVCKTRLKFPDWSHESLFQQRTIYFGEIHKGEVNNRPYEEIVDLKNLTKKLELFMQTYNQKNKKAPLSLVFFGYAVTHILRISRVLRQPRGNAVLIGHGGTGKQTLCRFSAFIMDCTVSTFAPGRKYRVQEFRKDLKEPVEKAGTGRKVVLLLTDNNVIADFILEDINNLLNNGEIANLYEQQELSNILDNANITKYQKENDLMETRQARYETFINFTRENLHIVFCTSPVGDTLRLRVRKFPSLVNCCNLNWFVNWPKEALVSCCQRVYNQLGFTNQLKDTLVELSATMHNNIEVLTEKYMAEVSRRVYVTPKSFLDMCALFSTLSKVKKTEIDSVMEKLAKGVKKLNETHKQIIIVEEKLTKLEPELVEKSQIAMESAAKVLEQDLKLQAKYEIVNENKAYAMKNLESLRSEQQKIEFLRNKVDEELTITWKIINDNIKSDTIALMLNDKTLSMERKKCIVEAIAYIIAKKPLGNDLNKIRSVIMEEGNKKIKNHGIKDEIMEGKISDNVMQTFKNHLEVIIPKAYDVDLNTMDQEHFVDLIKSKYNTLGVLYLWGTVIVKYWELENTNKPLKAKILEKQHEKEIKDRELEQLNEEVRIMNEQFKELKESDARFKKEIKELEDTKRINTHRMENARKLIGLLKDEGIRWEEQLRQLQMDDKNFLGNIFLSTVIISYLSPFTGVYRNIQIELWKNLIIENNIGISSDFSLDKVLSDPVTIRNWNIANLPSDTVSIQNGIMLFNNPKYSLLIDPQLQANTWLKKLMKKQGLVIYKAETKEEHYKKQVESIQLDIIRGSSILIENVSEQIDAIFNSVINKAVYDEDGLNMLDFNGQKIQFNNNFNIYFTTKLANPHYPPEYYIRLNIVNFTVTTQGLQEQLLSDVFKKECRDQYEIRDKIIEDMGNANLQLSKFAKEILDRLANADENAILDDDGLVDTLEQAKVVSDQVKIQVEKNVELEETINNIRDKYIPVAIRGSLLYFVIVDLSLIDPMYQFSLEYFKKIFLLSIEKAPMGVDSDERVLILEEKITEDIFRNIKRGIFESHKTIFAFLIAIFIKKEKKLIGEQEWSLFLKGPLVFDKTDLLENPDKNYFSDLNWDTLLFCEEKLQLTDLSSVVSKKLPEFTKFFADIQNFNEFKDMPGEFDLKTDFIRLLFIKIFRPDRLLFFIKKYIVLELGEYFVDNSPPKIEELFYESDNKTPIIFILSQGVDPTNTLYNFEEKYKAESGINTALKVVSLGQGQESTAKEGISVSMKEGKWIGLANCHLFSSWMPELANIVQMLQEDEIEDVNPNFRLWLTSMPNQNFPVSILQNSLKLTTEPPAGIKANIQKVYDDIKLSEYTVSEKKKSKFFKIMFNISLFHAVMQERKKFGPIGFNLRYDFNQTDFDTSLKFVSLYLGNDDEEEEDILQTLKELIGKYNYGGRITDDWDRRTMKHTLNRFLPDTIFENRYYQFCDKYYSPDYEHFENYQEFIHTFPLFDEPEIFGLNENANIIFQLQESNKIINSLLLCIPKTNNSGKTSSDSIVMDLIKNFSSSKLIKINPREARHKTHDKIFSNGLNHSYTIVMEQEIEKYNRLIGKIIQTLADLKSAIDGTISMSSECDEIYNSLLINKIPLSWAKFSYPSHKPLASWFDDLFKRLDFIRAWVSNGHPHVFWVSGLFFPQGFITGVQQNYAREANISIADITFKYTVLNKYKDDVIGAPTVGVYIHGLYLEAGNWDIDRGLLVDQQLGQMFCTMPVIWLETLKEVKKNQEDDDEDEENTLYQYKCPVFKTTKRTGIISASGRSDNHVLNIVKDFFNFRICPQRIIKNFGLIEVLR
jgi:dynein heavy chain